MNDKVPYVTDCPTLSEYSARQLDLNQSSAPDNDRKTDCVTQGCIIKPTKHKWLAWANSHQTGKLMKTTLFEAEKPFEIAQIKRLSNERWHGACVTGWHSEKLSFNLEVVQKNVSVVSIQQVPLSRILNETLGTLFWHLLFLSHDVLWWSIPLFFYYILLKSHLIHKPINLLLSKANNLFVYLL